MFGGADNPTSKLIRELTYEQFCQLAPINYSGLLSSSVAPASSDSCGSESESDCSPSGMRRSPSQLLRKLKNAVPASPGEPSLDVWGVEQEDHFPSLQQVFEGVPPGVAFDIEVKMTTPDDVEVTSPEEVSRQLDAILAVVDAQLAATPRVVLFSSFDPEVCVELKRRRPQFPVMFLSGGGAYAHVDARRTSIPAAIDFAAEAGLQGIILETATLRAQAEQVEAARARGLAVSGRLGGGGIARC